MSRIYFRVEADFMSAACRWPNENDAVKPVVPWYSGPGHSVGPEKHLFISALPGDGDHPWAFLILASRFDVGDPMFDAVYERLEQYSGYSSNMRTAEDSFWHLRIRCRETKTFVIARLWFTRVDAPGEGPLFDPRAPLRDRDSRITDKSVRLFRKLNAAHRARVKAEGK